MNKQLELIPPEWSPYLVLAASVLLSLVCALLGFIARKARGLIAVLVGPMVLGLWALHGALVARWGMDSLGLLAFEGLVFVALGALVGWGWKRMGAAELEN